MSVTELLEQAQARGIKQLALTDINSTSGCIEFAMRAPKYGITPYIGVDFRNGTKQEYVVIAHSLAGFKEINDFLSDIRMHNKDVPTDAPAFENCTTLYPWQQTNSRKLTDNEYWGISINQCRNFRAFATEAEHEKAVALPTVTFRDKQDFDTHRILRAISLNTLGSKLTVMDHAIAADTFLKRTHIENYCRDIPKAQQNAETIAGKGTVDFAFGTNKNKRTFTGSAENDNQLLRELATKGLAWRYRKVTTKVRKRFEMELNKIETLGFTSYFLINWDIVQFAKSKSFYHIGRGSGANSIIAYCMDITNVDPIKLNLPFERFINASRKNPPDFDIDFSHTDRDEIRQYIFDKYPNCVALVGSYSTFERRSCIRSVGKVFGITDDEIVYLQSLDFDKEQPTDRIGRLVMKFARRIYGLPNSLSVHACGIAISEEPITNYTTLELMPVGFPSTQFSMLELEYVGLFKYDILSQRGLGHIKEAVALILSNLGITVDIFDYDKFTSDPRLSQMLLAGDTIGCFYIESPAMRQLLRKTQSGTYPEVVAASSIIRPGVSSSGMSRMYLVFCRDKASRINIHPILGKILPDTYGIMVYQEDVMKVGHSYAGLTMEECDILRRGMSGKYRSSKEFMRLEETFMENCKKLGRSEKDAADVWKQISSFAGYSFAKGHSASYALESYQSLYLRAYYPIEFITAVLNNFGGYYRTEFYLHEARMLGATIELPCVNESDELFRLTGKTIYTGLRLIKDLENKTITNILHARKNGGAFTSFADFLSRVAISLEQLRILIRIKAFRFTGAESRKLLWEAYQRLSKTKKSRPALQLFAEHHKPRKTLVFDRMPFDDELDEMKILGYFISSPFAMIRKSQRNCINASMLTEHVGKTVHIRGFYIAEKSLETPKGEDMEFGCFVDEQGTMFDTVHFPQSLRNYPFRGRGVYEITGKVVSDYGVESLEVYSMHLLEWSFSAA